jgi:pentapeptide MXKDX repeat protein
VEKEMKRIPFLAIVLLTFAFPAPAQDVMKNDAMKNDAMKNDAMKLDSTKNDAALKPADPESKVVLDSWNEVGRKLIAMAEDFPEDKYDFKPTPAERSFAEQLLHAAGSMYYFTKPAMGQKPPAAEDPKRDQYKTKADVVTFVKKSVADGAAAIQSTGEKGLTTEVVYYPGQKARVLDIAYGLIEHSGEHYGQLVVYYRLAALVPPESRPKK